MASNVTEATGPPPKKISKSFSRVSNSVFQLNIHLRYPTPSGSRISFGVTYEKRNWAENIRCNAHTAGLMGVEAVSPSFVLANRRLQIDYRFFYQPKDEAKRQTIHRVLSGLACPQ